MKSNIHIYAFTLILILCCWNSWGFTNLEQHRINAKSHLFGDIGNSSMEFLYEEAREVRILEGASTAVPLFRNILMNRYHLHKQQQDKKQQEGSFQNKHDHLIGIDTTAASLIAANERSLTLQDRSCCVGDNIKDIHELRKFLLSNGFTRIGVNNLFGIAPESEYASAFGPVYVKPAQAGATCPDQLMNPQNSLEFLVKMFVLGFAISREDLENNLPGGKKALDMFEKFGLVFPFNLYPELDLVVPYVQLFPMEVDGKDYVFVTDWHPTTLMATIVGEKLDGAVMYIGPDSLALQQHLPCEALHFKNITGLIKVLDLCCGSGIQGILLLARLGRKDKCLFVDINPRALRFTSFNALLNGLDGSQVITSISNLSSDSLDLKTITNASYDAEDQGFHVILANPPFLPVPSCDINDKYKMSIARRHGFFSDGGCDGEKILETIIKISSLAVEPKGFIGIVSEFMNPGKELCQKLECWFDQKSKLSAYGLLLTNESPISRTTYAERRASNTGEFNVWNNHLKIMKIENISPGLLFMETNTNGKSVMCHKIIPKHRYGTIWTPHNTFARNASKREWRKSRNDFYSHDIIS